MDNSFIPAEYQAELDKLNRRQQMAQALMMQAMRGNQPQQMGPVASKISPLATIAQVLTGVLAGRAGDQSLEQMAGIRKKAENAQAEELGGLTQLPLEQRIPQGMSSRNPMIRKLAEAWQKAQEERVQKFGDVVKDTDPETAARVVGSGMLPSEGWKMPPVRPTEYGTTPSGSPFAVTFDRKQQPTLKFEPKETRIELNTGEKGADAAAKALGGKVPEVLDASRKEYLSALDSRQSAERINKLLENPQIITGFGADARTGLASLGSLLGFQGPAALEQTQALISELAKQTLANVRLLPGAITEKERPFLETAAAGKLDYSPQALRHLANLAIATNHNRMLNAVQQHNAASSVPGAEAGKSMYPLPQFGGYTLDEKLFPETINGRVSYTGVLETPPKLNVPGGNPKSGLSPQEEQEMEQLRKRLEELRKGRPQ